ncbi:MAG: triose-phosphate isomerase [Deltaproteobacteria bacterium]|nr:MAG: triose-phosphate isomerase [Deltaproteobacteria bacterium]
MRKPVIAGNWKMNKTKLESIKLVTELRNLIPRTTGVDIIIAPPFTALTYVFEAISGSSVTLAAQNCHWEDSGAYTGEVSPPMLKDLGCSYVILGHSERRQYFGETDSTVNKKLKSVLRSDLIPIMCVGESLEERRQEKTFSVVEGQMKKGLAGLTSADFSEIIIAYEPIWAIGTGETATPAQAQEVHQLIRKILGELFGKNKAVQTRIQYGGSVKPENIDELMAQEDIDGALVGGASLEARTFAKIINFKPGD